MLHELLITCCYPRLVFSDVLFQTHFSEDKTILIWKTSSSFSNPRADRSIGGWQVLGHSLGVFSTTLHEHWLVGYMVITGI